MQRAFFTAPSILETMPKPVSSPGSRCSAPVSGLTKATAFSPKDALPSLAASRS